MMYMDDRRVPAMVGCCTLKFTASYALPLAKANIIEQQLSNNGSVTGDPKVLQASAVQ